MNRAGETFGQLLAMGMGTLWCSQWGWRSVGFLAVGWTLGGVFNAWMDRRAKVRAVKSIPV